MKNIKNICVIGDGGWGTTLAVVLAKKGFNVTIWGVFPEYIEILKKFQIDFDEKYLLKDIQ